MYRLRLAIVHNTIAPYRHPLFEKLSRDWDLMVYYCSTKNARREWDLWPRSYCYKHKLLPRIPIRISIEDESLNPSIVKELILNKPSALVLSDYTSPTVWLAFAVAKFLRIPLIYWTEGLLET